MFLHDISQSFYILVAVVSTDVTKIGLDFLLFAPWSVVEVLQHFMQNRMITKGNLLEFFLLGDFFSNFSRF